MVRHLGFILIQTIMFFVYSNEIMANQDSDKFLIYYEQESIKAQSSPIYNLVESSKEGVEIKPIRCFWLETNSMNVFDLKDLKRPFNQK